MTHLGRALAWLEANDLAEADDLIEPLARAFADLDAEVEQRTENGCVLSCAFCGAAYPPKTTPSQNALLVEHISKCPKHPMRELEVVVEAAQRLWDCTVAVPGDCSVASGALNDFGQVVQEYNRAHERKGQP